MGDYSSSILRPVEGEENVVRAIKNVRWDSKLFKPTPEFLK